jgi:hypothetical protein
VEQRFELDGADHARKFLLDRGFPATAADVAWEAIALHSTPRIPSRMGPEIAATHNCVLTDVLGVGLDKLDRGLVNEITAVHPRGDFKNGFLQAGLGPSGDQFVQDVLDPLLESSELTAQHGVAGVGVEGHRRVLVNDRPGAALPAKATRRAHPHADLGAVPHRAADPDQEVAEREIGSGGDFQVADLVPYPGAVRRDPPLQPAGRVLAAADERADHVVQHEVVVVVGGRGGGVPAAERPGAGLQQLADLPVAVRRHRWAT